MSDDKFKKILELVDVNEILQYYDAHIVSCDDDEIRVHCILPEHQDNNASASFNTRKKVYGCYVCGGYSVFQLIKELEGFDNYRDVINFLSSKFGWSIDNEEVEDTVIFNFKKLERKQTEYNTIEDVKIRTIDEGIFYSTFPSALDYFDKVKSRVNSKDVIKKYNIRYCKNGYYRNRFVIPIFYEGKMTTTFCARSIFRSADDYIAALSTHLQLSVSQKIDIKEHFRKVLFPPKPNNQAKYLFFNWDNAVTNSEYVIVVEGILDAIKIAEWGFNVIANLTLFLNDYKRSMILSHFDKLFLCMDNDHRIKIEKKGQVIKNPGQEVSLKTASELQEFIDVKNITLPAGKDPDECTYDEFNCAFLNANRTNNENDEKNNPLIKIL